MPQSGKCGWRCARWEEAFRHDGDHTGVPAWRAAGRQRALHNQLAAELCESTPELLRKTMGAALRSLREGSVKELTQLGRRARFQLLNTDAHQQGIAKSLIGNFTEDWRTFESTVKALAA